MRVREQLANRALKRAEARARDAVETRDADAAVAIQSICRRRQARARVSEIAVASHADEHRSRLDEESLEAATSAASADGENSAGLLLGVCGKLPAACWQIRVGLPGASALLPGNGTPPTPNSTAPP